MCNTEYKTQLRSANNHNACSQEWLEIFEKMLSAWCMDAQMLQRNMGVKRAPERWQDNRDVFDAVVTFDERIMEQLLDGEATGPAMCTIDISDHK